MLNELKSKKKTILSFCLISALCIFTYFAGYNSNQNTNINKDDLLRSKNEIITELNKKYNNLLIEHKKSQELINAITNETKRLAQELKESKNVKDSELVFNEKDNRLGLNIVSDHIKTNESFSSTPYCDSDGKYRNGYGTLANLVTYKIGDTVKVRDCKGKNVILTASKGNQKLPERKISEQEALNRKEEHIIKYVFPYLYGKHFRSAEEFIVATDVIYNRGIAQSKSLFDADGTINCKSLHKYMGHTKKAYQQAMMKRYAKNYALCIQS